jgi:hypothetical protein
MFCSKCGNKLTEGAKFCTKCGTALNMPPVPNNSPIQPHTEQQSYHAPVKQIKPRKKLPIKIKAFVIAGSIIIITVIFLAIYLFYVDVDIYACGSLDSKAVYWKNGKRVELPIRGYDEAIANSIYFSGNDVYVCGSAKDKVGRKPIYWKNGNMVELPSFDFVDAGARSIFVSGNDVYVYGSGSETIGETNGGDWVYRKFEKIYWKNEKLFFGGRHPTHPSYDTYIFGNDEYICGNVITFYGYKAAYWKNGNLVQLPSAYDYSYAKSIYVSGNDVYVCGKADDKVVYWKNGKLVKLINYNKNQGTGESSIFVTGNNVYVACVVFDDDDDNDNSYIVLWKNNIIVRVYSIGMDPNISDVLLKKK